MKESAQTPPPAAPVAPPAAPEAPPNGAKSDGSGDLDLEVLEIQRPELMKEGFVGQER